MARNPTLANFSLPISSPFLQGSLFCHSFAHWRALVAIAILQRNINCFKQIFHYESLFTPTQKPFCSQETCFKFATFHLSAKCLFFVFPCNKRMIQKQLYDFKRIEKIFCYFSCFFETQLLHGRFFMNAMLRFYLAKCRNTGTKQNWQIQGDS